MSYLSRIIKGKMGVQSIASAAVLASVVALAAPYSAHADGVFNYWDVSAKDSVKNGGAPELLSKTALYTGLIAKPKISNSEIFHFDVNSALWSDNAHKNRWVYVPNGKKIGFIPKGDYYTYPDSVVFIKQFDIDTIPGDTNSRVFWETRLLINIKEADSSAFPTITYNDKWYGYSYKWNKDQKDAKLVTKNGLNDTLRVYPNGVNQVARWKQWTFPGRSQCITCHNTSNGNLHGRSVLGFFTAQLNRPHPDEAQINQIKYFFQKGLFSGTEPSNYNDTAIVPKWAAITDSTASIDVRARSYIAANCSGCHGERGNSVGATHASLNYDFHTMVPQMEFRNRSVGCCYSSDSLDPLFFRRNDTIMNPKHLDTLRIQYKLVIAGYPEKSMVLYRQRARDTTPLSWKKPNDQMPPLATYEVNVAATALIEKWIREMPELRDTLLLKTSIRHFAARSMLKSPTIDGRMLHLPAEMISSGNQKIYITNITGRNFELSMVNATTYSVPLYLASGLYVIHVGNQTFKGYLF